MVSVIPAFFFFFFARDLIWESDTGLSFGPMASGNVSLLLKQHNQEKASHLPWTFYLDVTPGATAAMCDFERSRTEGDSNQLRLGRIKLDDIVEMLTEEPENPMSSRLPMWDMMKVFLVSVLPCLSQGFLLLAARSNAH